MKAEEWKIWQRIFRDLLTAVLGTFILLWQTVATSDPSPLLVGAGLTLLGIPAVLRIDERRVRQREQGDA